MHVRVRVFVFVSSYCVLGFHARPGWRLYAGAGSPPHPTPPPHPPHGEVRTRTKASVSPVFISRHHLYAASLRSLQPKPIRHRAPGLKETLSVNLYVLTKRLTAPEERDAMWALCVKPTVCSRVTERNCTSDCGHTRPNQLCCKIQTMELFLRGCRNQKHPDAHLPPIPLFPLCRWVLITGSLCGAEMGL